MFAATLPGIGAYFGNRSFVLHFPNKTRITCANFQLLAGNGTLPCVSNSTSANATAVAGPPSPPWTPAATTPTQSVVSVSGAGVVSTSAWSFGVALLFAAMSFIL